MLFVSLLFCKSFPLSLLLQKPLFFSSFFFFGLLSSLQGFLSLSFVFFQLFWVWLLLLQIIFHLLEYFYDLLFRIFLYPFFHFVSALVLFSRFNIINDDIVEIIVHDLANSITSFTFFFIIFRQCVELKLEFIDKNLLSFSNINFSFSLGEANFGMGDFDSIWKIEREFHKLLFKHFLCNFGVVLHFPMPWVDIPDGASSLLFFTHIVVNY